MELRQLRYFVTLSEELHFGRAAARELIVQSAMSQQLTRLERELGVRLLDRDTHHTHLTGAGAVFLIEARQILTRVDRATAAARRAPGTVAALRVAVLDAGYDSMPQILRETRARHPALVIHQVEASVPEQYQRLTDGRLDIGIGRATHAPSDIASRVIRHDPLGVLLPTGHPYAAMDAVPVTALAHQALLFAEHARAPEFNQFTAEMCRDAGFTPAVYDGTVQSIHAAADLVAQGRCLYCLPCSGTADLPGTTWRPLTQPASCYPWSILWRAADTSADVNTVLTTAHALAQRLNWLTPTQASEQAVPLIGALAA